MKKWCLVFLVLFLASCAQPSPKVKEVTDDQAVYQAVFSYYEDRTPVVREYSSYDGDSDPARLQIYFKDRVAKETIDDFVKANEKATSLRELFAGTSEPRIITKKEKDAMFRAGLAKGWIKFHKRYGKCSWLYSLSNIGYNPDHTEALVHIDMIYAPVVGEEFIISLKKENGVWQVVESKMLRVS